PRPAGESCGGTPAPGGRFRCGFAARTHDFGLSGRPYRPQSLFQEKARSFQKKATPPPLADVPFLESLLKSIPRFFHHFLTRGSVNFAKSEAGSEPRLCGSGLYERRLYRSAARYQADEPNHKEKEKADLRDACRHAGDAEKPQGPRNQSNNQKYQCPMQHFF